MHRARCPVILVLATLAMFSLGVSSQADRDQDPYQNQDLDLELRHHRPLQRARSAGLLSQFAGLSLALMLTADPVISDERSQSGGTLGKGSDWSKRAVEDLLAQMSRPEVDAQQDEPDGVSRVTGSRLNLERSVDNNARERKAGCKNFYWKGLTSC